MRGWLNNRGMKCCWTAQIANLAGDNPSAIGNVAAVTTPSHRVDTRLRSDILRVVM
jgi:hypothetical protein